MAGRILAVCSIFLALVFEVGCGQSAQLSSITVTPSSATIPSVGGTTQFQATGYFVNGKNGNSNNQNLTNQVTWTSSTPSVATINSSGLATAVGVGTTTITATGGNGGITSTADLTVTDGSGGGGAGSLTSITVVPTEQTVNQPGETAQYIAIGTFTGSPSTQDMTNQVTWSSSDVRIATVNSSGLATGVGNCGGGSTTIVALAPPSSGTALTGTATFSTGTCGGNNLPTLTVYDVGQGSGAVTSNPPPINCTPAGGAGCTGNFTLGTGVTLTAVPASGDLFGGFSANCTPVIPDPSSCTAKESNVQSCTCSVSMTDNVTVGAIFNKAQ